MKRSSADRITGVAILLALEIVLQTIAFLVRLGPVSLNLALIPIAIAAIVYGPVAGAFIGLCNGAIVLIDPSTQAVFLNVAPLGTILTCLLKCTIAGFISGLVFKIISKKNRTVGAIIASILVPVVNTGLFALSPILVIAMQQESGFDAMVLLPAIGSVITNYAFYLKNVKTTKALNIFGQTFYIAYNAILIQSTSALSILQLICSVTFFVSACIGIVMIFNKERITQNPDK